MGARLGSKVQSFVIGSAMIACSVIVASTPAWGVALYGLSSGIPGSLYTIDTTTGAATFVTDLTGINQTSFVGLASRNGTLYASDVFAGGEWSFGSINAATGAFTVINLQGGDANWQSLTYKPSVDLFYTVDAADLTPLYSVTPSGVISTIGNTGIFFRDLAYDTDNDTLYGVDSLSLYTIDTSTGTATSVGLLGTTNPRAGLAYDGVTHTLFMNFGAGPAGDNLYTVNILTGAATFVGANGSTAGNGIDGIAFLSPAAASVPEPATLALLAAAFAGMGVARRRKLH